MNSQEDMRARRLRTPGGQGLRRGRFAVPPVSGRDRVPAVLWLLLGVMGAIELVLSLAERGLIGNFDWRMVALLHGAFWPPLLDGSVRPLYEAQPFTMFLSHAFLHGGFFHLAMNGVVLLALGKFIAERAGSAGMMLLFVVAAIGGGAVFALLEQGPAPMVGASGAVFGFLGVWQYWEAMARLREGFSLRPVLSTLGALVAVNVVMAIAMGGALAWQAHLGGFLAGVALGPVLTWLARRRANIAG